MELSHKNPFLHSAAMEQLEQFVLNWRTQWTDGTPDFEQFERELHEYVMAFERELVEGELTHYDVTAEEIEVDGEVYRYTLTSSETYLSAAGPVTVTRNLYRPSGRGSRSVCPLELRAGIIGGYWTPRAARQAAFAMAEMTSSSSEALFGELGGMTPSRSSLDRLPKELSSRWENHREEWEDALRAQETVPEKAAVIAISVDGVSVRMKNNPPREKRRRPGKHASGPRGQRQAGCGAVILYDAEEERLQTIRYGRMPEAKKITLGQQLEAEVAGILALRPDLKRVLLSDGEKDNWRLLNEVYEACDPSSLSSIEILDFCHACEHLKEACDTAWGESTPRSQTEFEKLKTLLKEADDGVKRVICMIRYHWGRASGRKRERLRVQLTYFSNQQHRMRYAEYAREGLPIASGVMEASCKTLVTQRLKQSGMTWTLSGGQAILTVRSLIQSNRWQGAWKLLAADYRKSVTIRGSPQPLPNAAVREQPAIYEAAIRAHIDYASVPIVA